MTERGARDELSRTLRALRAVARMSQVEAGKRAGIGQHAVSRLERGLYRPSGDEAAALASAYGASAEDRSRIRRLAEELQSEVVPARVILSRGASAQQQRIGRIEEESELIRAFHPSIVLGLLQTAAYIRVLFTGPVGVKIDPVEVELAITARLDRQRVFEEPAKRFVLIQAEGALRWQVGSADVMAEQLEHLADLATRSERLRLGIVPWTSPVQTGALHGFQLYDRRAVTVGTKTAYAIMTDEYDIEVYDELFAEYERLAVFGADAAELLRRIAQEYRDLGAVQ